MVSAKPCTLNQPPKRRLTSRLQCQSSTSASAAYSNRACGHSTTLSLAGAWLCDACVGWLVHVDMPTLQEQVATEEVLERLTHLPPPDAADTRLTMQRTAATTMSGVLSPCFEGEGSSHPQGEPAVQQQRQQQQQQIALTQQGRRTSASQVGPHAAEEKQRSGARPAAGVASSQQPMPNRAATGSTPHKQQAGRC